MNILYYDHSGKRIKPSGWRDANDVLRPFSLLAKLTDEELSELGVTKEIYEEPPVFIESIESVLNKKNTYINDSRLTANKTFFTFNGKQIACDDLSRSDIDATNGIVALTNNLPPNWVGGWKCIDNTYVTIASLQDWIAFYSAMVQQGLINFSKSQTLKNQLNTIYNSQLSDEEKRVQMEAISWENQS